MKRRVLLSVEQLEARNTPSRVSATGAFLPPGAERAVGSLLRHGYAPRS